MNRFRKLSSFAVALVAAAIVGAPTPAYAIFQMRITSSTGATRTITDEDFSPATPTTSPDMFAGAGTVTFLGGVGGFGIQVNTGMSYPVTGSPANPHMDLNYVVTKTVAGAETLTIEISHQGFTTSPLPLTMNYGGTNGTGQTSTYVAGTGLNNALYNTGDANDSLGAFGGGAFSGTGGFTVPSNGLNPYSLTLRIVITSNGVAGRVASGDAELLATAPAPAGLVLALSGVPVLGIGQWVRRRRSSTTA